MERDMQKTVLKFGKFMGGGKFASELVKSNY